MASRILTLQRQARELGRLRLGYTAPTGNGKSRPVRSNTWVLTSHSEDYIKQAAALWGGDIERWKPQGNGAEQWRVITKTPVVDAILPPGDPLSQHFEMWNRGGCARRCDGQTEALSDSACLCRAEFGDDFHTQKAGTVCDIVSRLNVMLPELEDIGVWRMDSGSYYAANEVAAQVDIIRGALGDRAMVPVRLRITPRTRTSGGETKQFVVPVLELRGVTAGQLLSGGGGIQALSAAPDVPVRAIEQADDVSDLVSACESPDDVRELWRRLGELGQLSDAAKTLLTARAKALQPADEAIEATVEPDAGVLSVDDAWSAMVAEAGKHGLTASAIEELLATRYPDVGPDKLTSAELVEFTQALKAGQVAA